ncbi:MAG: ABC transporter ATP-binding protein, partial [Acidobacteria bacterium]
MNSVPVLEATGVRFRHHGATAPLFDRLSLSLSGGEFAGIIGPNGSGKTTLLRVLSGVVSPEAGDIRLGGRPLRSIPPRERARLVAVVFQETQVLFNFSVLEIA